MGKAVTGLVAAAVAVACAAASPAGPAAEEAAGKFGAPPAAASPGDPLAAAEAALWDRLRDGGRAEEVEAFLVLFPGSRFAAEARRRRDELAAEARAQKPAPPPGEPVPPNLSTAAAAAAVAPDCGLLSAAVDGASVALAGVLREGQERLVRSMLDAFGVPASAARLRVEAFEGPYCDALSAVVMNTVAPPPDGPPRVALLGGRPLGDGERLRFRVEMPAWPAHLSAFYLTVSGEAATLVADAQPRPAGAALVLEDPRWRIAAPFGTDLLLVVASDAPLFDRRRPAVEKLEDFTPALSAALGRARRAAGRVSARAVVVETAAAR